MPYGDTLTILMEKEHGAPYKPRNANGAIRVAYLERVMIAQSEGEKMEWSIVIKLKLTLLKVKLDNSKVDLI
jgi:hypothetical protein